MSQQFDAIYDNGVFRPLKPVGFREHEVVSISVTSSDDTKPAVAETNQHQALLAFAAQMEALSEEMPQDGATGRHHDRILYGE